MTISYHELAASSGAPPARNTPAERKQFLTICVVGVAILAHAFIKAGILEPVNIKNDGIYPGGQFVYKYLEQRDYAVTGGLLRIISEDLKVIQSPEEAEVSTTEDKDYDDILYSVLIDNGDTDIPMGDGRFFSGILIDKSQSSLKDGLIGLNGLNVNDLDNADLKSILYEVGDLPSVRSAVAVFPYTGGFVSALLNNYKVYPALLEYAMKHHKKGEKVIISSSCSASKKRCHFYVPMTKVNSFLLDRPSSEEYKKTVLEGISYGFNFGAAIANVKKLVGL